MHPACWQEQMGWMVDMEQGTEGPCSAAHEPKKKGWHTASIFYLPAPLPAHADGCPSANHSLPPPEVSLPAVSQICYLILHNSVAKCLYFSSHVLLKEPRTYSQQLDKASKPEWRTQRRNFIYTNVNHPWALRKRQRKKNSNKYNGLEKMAERCDYILTSKIPLSSKLAFRRQWINKAKHILICQKSAEKKTPMDKNLK